MVIIETLRLLRARIIRFVHVQRSDSCISKHDTLTFFIVVVLKNMRQVRISDTKFIAIIQDQIL